MKLAREEEDCLFATCEMYMYIMMHTFVIFEKVRQHKNVSFVRGKWEKKACEGGKKLFLWQILCIKSFLKWPVGNCGVLSEMAGFSKVAQMFDRNRQNSQRMFRANQTENILCS